MQQLIPVTIETIDFENKNYIFRHSFEVSDLENSIRFEGLLYPPILMDRGDGDKKIIVSGYRRLLACRNLGFPDVPCIVHQSTDFEKEDFLKISIAENTKRKDLKPIEIAEALKRIKEELNLSIEELAGQFGETFGIGSRPDRVEQYMKLTEFDADTKSFIADSKIKGLEFELANVEENEDRETVMNLVKSNDKLKQNQLHKIIENAKKIEGRGNKKNMREVFDQEDISNILKNEELQGSKKINAFLDALEKEAEPEKVGRVEKINQLLNELDQAVREVDGDYIKCLSVRKPNLEKPSVRITMDISETKQLVDLMKVLYERRKDIIEGIIKA